MLYPKLGLSIKTTLLIFVQTEYRIFLVFMNIIWTGQSHKKIRNTIYSRYTHCTYHITGCRARTNVIQYEWILLSKLNMLCNKTTTKQLNSQVTQACQPKGKHTMLSSKCSLSPIPSTFNSWTQFPWSFHQHLTHTARTHHYHHINRTQSLLLIEINF